MRVWGLVRRGFTQSARGRVSQERLRGMRREKGADARPVVGGACVPAQWVMLRSFWHVWHLPSAAAQRTQRARSAARLGQTSALTPTAWSGGRRCRRTLHTWSGAGGSRRPRPLRTAPATPTPGTAGPCGSCRGGRGNLCCRRQAGHLAAASHALGPVWEASRLTAQVTLYPGPHPCRHIRELAKTNPPAFICHYYNHYFAHTAGGRMIGAKVSQVRPGGGAAGCGGRGVLGSVCALLGAANEEIVAGSCVSALLPPACCGCAATRCPARPVQLPQPVGVHMASTSRLQSLLVTCLDPFSGRRWRWTTGWATSTSGRGMSRCVIQGQAAAARSAGTVS